MILLINVFLTSKRFSSFDRGLLSDVDALTAFRFMLHSLTDLRFSQIFIFAELDPDNYDAAAAAQLEAEVHSHFAGTPLTFRNKRLLQLQDWRTFLNDTLLPANEPVFYSGNHDHVFMDSNTDVLEACLARLIQLRPSHHRVSFILSHWAEYFSYRPRLLLQEPYGFIHTSHYRDAMQILTPELLREWFFEDCAQADPATPIRRTEDLGWVGKKSFLQIIPGKEQFRHLDAGSHFGVRARHVPPLAVPAGLLEKELRLAYFASPDIQALQQHRAAGYCCISPCMPAAAVNANGVDFQWSFADIPAFLLRQAKEVVCIGAETADTHTARNRRVAAMLNDLLPMPPETLAHLAPLAISAHSTNEPLRLDEPAGGSRRTETLFALKVPVGHRPLAVIVSSARATVDTPPFWASLSPVQTHSIYLWHQERQNNSWHVQASAVHLGGENYPLLSGLYAYHYDFAVNRITPIRRLLPELDCDRVVLVHDQALQLAGISQWIEAHAHTANALLIGHRDQSEMPLVLSLPREWLENLLRLEPQLYAPEIFTLADVLLHAAKAHDVLPTLVVHQLDLSTTSITLPRQNLLRWITHA